MDKYQQYLLLNWIGVCLCRKEKALKVTKTKRKMERRKLRRQQQLPQQDLAPRMMMTMMMMKTR